MWYAARRDVVAGLQSKLESQPNGVKLYSRVYSPSRRRPVRAGPRPAVWCNWSRVVFAMAGCRYDYDAIRAGGATSSASAVGALSWAMELSDR